MLEPAHLKEVFYLARPKFLMYSNVMYTVGVAAAYKTNPESTFHLWSYIWICLLVHTIQAMTHYFNEYYDYEVDCANKNASPWTGGSRILVEGKVKRDVSLYLGRLIVLIALANVVICYVITSNIPLCAGLMLGIILGHGYSAWPLMTSRRGLGEVTVCFVLNVLTPLVGYQSLGPESPFGCAFLWPILLSLLPTQFVRMMVMNMADYESDKIGGKRTLVVRLGLDLSSKIHAVGMMFAHIVYIWLFFAEYISQSTFLLMLIPAPIGIGQVRNVLVRPQGFNNPFWSSQHNILSMAMALAAVLLSGGRPLSGESWMLVFPLVLVSVSIPVLFVKIVEAAKSYDTRTAKELGSGNGNGKVE